MAVAAVLGVSFLAGWKIGELLFGDSSGNKKKKENIELSNRIYSLENQLRQK